MLDSCCKEGKAEEAFKLLGGVEMMDTGFLPSDVTYNVVIDVLSKQGELDKAPRSCSTNCGVQEGLRHLLEIL